MQIRTAIPTDTPKLKPLWQYCFGYSEPFLSWSFERNSIPANELVAEENGMIAASARISPYAVSLCSQAVSAAYLSGICVAPQMRGRGLLRMMLGESISMMRGRGNVVSLVIPHDYNTFEKFGWRTCYFYKQYQLSPSDIPAYSMGGRIVPYTLSDTNYEPFQSVYSAFTSDKNGYIRRTAETWRLIMEDVLHNFGGHCVLFYDDNGQPCGYLLYLLHGSSLQVYELAYTNRLAYKSLMAYLKSHASQVDSISIKAPSSDLSHFDFCNSRSAVSLYPFVMARITDVRAALLIASNNFSGSTCLQVIDRFIPANSGTFLVTHGDVQSTDATADAVLDIGTLSQLFCGALSPHEAHILDLVDGTLPSGLFYKQNNFISMLFN